MEETFCVVGGDGFIGSSLVNSLLNRGFSVHATILPAPGKQDLSYLQRLPGGHERLKLFNADLRVEGSFDSPIHGCHGVFLVASPMILEPENPETEVVDVAIKGTINVLKACGKAKSVKRVVVTTSSCAMSPMNEQGVINGEPCSVESFWSPAHYFRSNTEQIPFWPYFVSKTLAEKSALSYAAEHNMDVVTIGPSVVGGTFITPYIPGSVKALFLPVLPGNEEVVMNIVRSIISAFGTFPVVHISDVCNAHIFLMEQPAARGRYLCSSNTLSITELAQFLTKRYPELKITDKLIDMDSAVPLNTQFKSGKLAELGFSFKYGLDDIFDDCIHRCKKMGLFTTE